MIDLSAERRLVKSPPELWAEISDPEALAKHLAEFGEIRITKLIPEHTVVWKGDLACGVARIESSGWGTKVVLSAEIPGPTAEVPEPGPEIPDPPPEPEPSPVTQPEPGEPDVAAEPESLERARSEPLVRERDEERMSLLARLFGVRWSKRPELQHLVPEPEFEAEPEPEPEPDPEPEQPTVETDAEQPVAEADTEEPRPEAVLARDADPEPALPARPEIPDFSHPIQASGPERGEEARDEVLAGIDPEKARAVLEGTLEALGAAHHRPFSRA